MITSLTNLTSFNDAQGRRIQVLVSVDNAQTDTTLECKIYGESITKKVILAPGQSEYISIDHQQSGSSVITVKDTGGSNQSTEKLLNLDDATCC